MKYQFEFVQKPSREGYGQIYRMDEMYVLVVDGTDKELLFMVCVEAQRPQDCLSYLEMYDHVRTDNWQTMTCWVAMPDYAAHYFINTIVDKDGNKFVTISERFYDTPVDGGESFKLVLPWEKCDQESFVEFLKQLVDRNVPKESDDVYGEYMKMKEKLN